MEHKFSEHANSRSGSHEISRPLRDLKVHYRDRRDLHITWRTYALCGLSVSKPWKMPFDL
jgi:hypothetical protein